MKLFVIGANGYVGSEIYYTAQTGGFETVGTYANHSIKGLVRFRVEDETTWRSVKPQDSDVIIWAAAPISLTEVSQRFAQWLHSLPKKAVFVYLSSDIVLCPRALQSETAIGEYARGKLAEQQAVLARPNSICLTTGPVFGTNSRGELDKRTKKLLESSEKKHEYWSDVYKTFVPIEGLVRTLFENLDKRGHFFVGPPIKQSFFDFYMSRAVANGMKPDLLVATSVSDEELEKLGQCRDISYGDSINRIWAD